jgi:hypothetical protein
MSRDIELRLQTYANTLVDNHLQREYDIQLSKWRTHVNNVGAAYALAVDKHQHVLQEARDKQKADNELTMAALSFAVGFGMSWLSGWLQYALAPRFFDMTPRYVFSRGPNFPTDGFKSPPHEFVHIFGHVFGELPEQVKEFGSDTVLKTEPKDEKVGNSLAGIATSGSPEVFKANLKNALEEEWQKMTKMIGSLALSIIQDQNYGKSCLKRLVRLNPQSARASADMQEALAKRMIVDDIDRHRREWAKDWFYFGNIPFQEGVNAMSEKIEKEIWASWILDQDFGDPRPTDWGRDGIELDSIYDRMVELDIAIARTESQQQQQMFRVIDEGKEIPITDIGDDDLYKRGEVAAFIGWANNHKPDLIGGRDGGVSRIMGSILDIYK